MPRAVRFHEIGGPDVLRVEDVDVPDPGPARSGSAPARSASTGPRRCSAPGSTCTTRCCPPAWATRPPATDDDERLADAVDFLRRGLADGSLHPVVARMFTVDDVVAAHEYLESNQQFGKVVITVD